MQRSIGVLATRHLWAGIVEDAKLGDVKIYPDPGQQTRSEDPSRRTRSSPFCATRSAELAPRRADRQRGRRLPGRDPCGARSSKNLPTWASSRACTSARRLCAPRLKACGIDVPVSAINDADALAAGIAATYQSVEDLVRVWYLGDGIGFGRHPHNDGVWEAGHMVVSLDPKERFCGCGGIGHLEGIMGHRAMRLRFLDMEPEEVFAAARHNDARAAEFVSSGTARWPPAPPTASTATAPAASTWPGPMPISSTCACSAGYLQDMVKMSPLQGSYFEIVHTSHDLGADRRGRRQPVQVNGRGTAVGGR